MGESGDESNVTLDDTLAVFGDGRTTPFTAADIADRLDCSHSTAERNLTELAEGGELEHRQIDSGERIWWNPAPPPDARDEPHERVGEIHERITDAFYALDDDWRFTYVNERAEEIIQRSEEEVLGESIWEEFPEAAEGIVWEKYHEAMETQEPVNFDLYYEPLDVWVEINAYPSETGLSVYFLDVSDRVEREKELDRYRRILETINDGVYAVDSGGRFTMVNETYAEMLGYEREELVGEHVSKVVSDEVVEAAQDIEREQLAGEREAPTLEARLRTADGETITAEATFALLPVENGGYERLGVVRDVTERKEYERKIEEQRERYRRLVETAPVAIVTCDADGRIVFANEAAAEQVDIEEGLVGQSVLEFVHPDDRADAADRLHTVLEQREATPPTEMRILTVEEDVRHAIATAVPITNEGDPAAQIVLTDITERKRYEQRLNETVEELEQSNERLDSFASMLAHELRNPLNVAEIYFQQIDAPDSPAVEQVANALDRIEEMIDVLLVLAKGSDVVSGGQTVALPAVAEDAWETLETGPATLAVDTEQVVWGDEDHVQHLFENVFRNAIEHGGRDVTVRVGDLPETTGSSEERSPSGQSSGQGPREDETTGGFYVADDGPGIPSDERDDVFEAGYSTDDDGLGLGLTFIAQLADAYGWNCTVTESKDGGARFEFTDVALADEE